MRQDNGACCAICRTGRNPTVQHIGRTFVSAQRATDSTGRAHRITASVLRRQVQSEGVQTRRADRVVTAVGVFAKAFPESERSVWFSNLRLINVYDSVAEQGVACGVFAVKSLRGSANWLRLERVGPDLTRDEPD